MSDNPFKEAMLEMQQQGLGGDMPIMPGSVPEPKKKKEKKKAKA